MRLSALPFLVLVLCVGCTAGGRDRGGGGEGGVGVGAGAGGAAGDQGAGAGAGQGDGEGAGGEGVAEGGAGGGEGGQGAEAGGAEAAEGGGEGAGEGGAPGPDPGPDPDPDPDPDPNPDPDPDPDCEPGREVCDGRDNDCDDEVDEDDPDLGEACDTGIPGPCWQGRRRCAEGDLLCVGVVEASEEICDGIDNDCDGGFDEGRPQSNEECEAEVPGACGFGLTRCEDGFLWCDGLDPTDETCDGLDNDCDGEVDEGPEGEGGAEDGGPCETGEEGVCAEGVGICEDGELICEQVDFPEDETCDGRDNDCDGEVDEDEPEREFECRGAGWIYLTSSNGAAGFWGYEVVENTWVELPNPPQTTHTQLTNDGRFVYLMGDNNQVLRYSPQDRQWSIAGPGPDAIVRSPIGMFAWYDGGFCYLKDGQGTLYVQVDDQWQQLQLPATGSSAGTWDSATNELYIRTYSQLGHMVVDLETLEVVRTVADAESVGENSRSGSYLNGYFYTRIWGGPLQAFDGVTGERRNTGATPISGHTATDSDHNGRHLYIHGYGAQGRILQRYDPNDDSLARLADSADVSNHSTITVMR